MYNNPSQLSQLQPQQKAPQQHTQQQQQQQNSAKQVGGEIRSALSQSISMLSNQQHDSKQATLSTLAPLAPTLGVSQAGQILNLGGAGAGNAAVGGQILNIPNGAAGSGGQNFYVMIPQNQLDGASQLQKIAPMGNLHQSSGDALSQQRSDREEKRRQTHNEVERRRRSKINGWIQKLAEMVPSCKEEMGNKRGGATAPNSGMKSNCGVLQKTVNFIQELQIAHSQVVERLQEQNQVLVEMAKVRESLKRVEQENLLLRSQLQTHGIEPLDYTKQPPQVSRPNI